MLSSDNYSLPDASISGKIQLAPIHTNTKTNLECSTHNSSYKISLLSNKTDNNNHRHSDNHRFKNLSDNISMGRGKNGSKHTAVEVISNNNDNSYSSKFCDGIYSSSYDNDKVPSHAKSIFIDTMEYKVDNTAYHNYNIDHNYYTKRNHLQWIDDANLYKDCVEVSTVLLDYMVVDGLSRHDAKETTTITASMYNDPIIVDLYDIEDNIHQIVNLDNNSIRCTSSVNNINVHDHDDIAATSDSHSMNTISNFMFNEKYHNNTSNVTKSSIGGDYIEVEENDNNYNHKKDRLVEEKYYDNKLPRINAEPQHHNHHLSNNSSNLSDNPHNDNDFKKENITNKTSKFLSNTKLPPI